MTATAWSRRYLAYCRAHGVSMEERQEVLAANVEGWIDSERAAWKCSCSDLEFDSWLDDRFPEPATVSACWGGDQEFGF